MKRFARQILLPQIGIDGQKALQRSRVAVIGAGGLGTPVAVYLAAAGIGELHIVDGDRVDESNLQRQFLFSLADVGRLKAEIMGEWLTARFPDTVVKVHSQFLTKDLARTLWPEIDVVVDGTDNFSAKYLINDTCLIARKPWVYGSLYQFEAQVSVFHGTPCLRCLYPEPPRAKVQNCAEAGIIGATAGVVGSLQALEAIKLLALPSPSSKSHLQVFDFLSNQSLRLAEAPRARCVCQSGLNWSDLIEADQIKCDWRRSDFLLDVREDSERVQFAREGSFNWPLSKLQKGELPTLDGQRNYEVVCASGQRAQVALEIFKHNGIANVFLNSGSIYESASR